MTQGRGIAALVILYFATRVVLVWAATHPDAYAPRGAAFAADVDVFAEYASNVVEGDEAPYSGFFLEYPPGSLPFIVAPELLRPAHVPYRSAFVALMLVADVAGFAGLLVLASRWRSPLGPWMWTLLIPLTGPVAYVRLDLVPAVATIWAFERASVRSWFPAGAALGLGALAKVYPVLLLPAAVVAARRRGDLVAGAATLLVAPLLPLLGAVPEMTRQVLQYHARRGLHLESSFGSVLLILKRAGHDIGFVSSHATIELEGGISGALGTISKVAVLAAVGAGVWVLARPRPWPRRAPAAMFATLALAVGLGNVFSPQYVIWLAALGAVATCATKSEARGSVLLLLRGGADATRVPVPLRRLDGARGGRAAFAPGAQPPRRRGRGVDSRGAVETSDGVIVITHNPRVLSEQTHAS